MTRPKTPELKQTRQQPKAQIVKPAPGGIVGKPSPPPNLCEVATEFWDAFWASPLAALVAPTQLPALRRLFMMYDELEKAREAIHAEPPPKPEQEEDEDHYSFMARISDWNTLRMSQGRLVKTGHGGLRLNPLLDHMARLEVRIRDLEDRFGLSLRSHQELGLNVIRARTLAEQNAHQMEERGHQDALEVGSVDDDDPRAAIHVAS